MGHYQGTPWRERRGICVTMPLTPRCKGIGMQVHFDEQPRQEP